MSEPDEINDFLVRHGDPCQLPGEWARFKSPQAFFQPPRDSSALLAQLGGIFDRDDLLKAGILAPNNEGGIGLHPSLADQSSILIGLRKSAGDKPFCLLTENGCLCGRWPFTAMLADYRTHDLRIHGEPLLIASTIADVAILSTLKLAAVPAVGLRNFSRKSVSAFCRALRRPRHCEPSRRFNSDAAYGDDGAKKTLPIPLVLVGWDPSRLDFELPDNIQVLEQHLRGLDWNLGIDLDDVLIWKPTAGDVDRVRYCLAMGNGRDVRRAVLASLEYNCEPLIRTSNVPQGPDPPYGHRLAEWVALQWEPNERTRRQQAWQRLQAAWERDVIQPLVRQAQEYADPADRALGIALADVSRIMHPQALLLATNYGNAIGNDGVRAKTLLPAEELKQTLALADRIRAIAEELRRCQRKGLNNRRVVEPPKRSS